MKKIFVCSPYSGGTDSIELNVAFAQEVCRVLVKHGYAPFAPHLFYPQFLDDLNEEQRAAGLNCGIAWLDTCDEVWVFGPQSKGMRMEVILAERRGKPVKYLDIYNWRESFGKTKAIVTESVKR